MEELVFLLLSRVFCWIVQQTHRKFLISQVLPTQLEFRDPNSFSAITGWSSPPGSLDDFVAALRHISSLDGTAHQVDIINMSFCNERTNHELITLLGELSKSKVLIAAAGECSKCNAVACRLDIFRAPRASTSKAADSTIVVQLLVLDILCVCRWFLCFGCFFVG